MTSATTKNQKTRNLDRSGSENRIIEHATKLFLRKGYHGTSIDDITRAAKLTKGSFYWYFKSKEDMLRTILLSFEHDFLDELIVSIDGIETGTRDKLAKFIRFLPAFAYYNPELCVVFTTLSGELVGARHKIEVEIRRIYKKYQDFLAGLMELGMKDGMVREDLDPQLLASVIIALHNGILFQWFMNKGKIDEQAYVGMFNKVFLGGIESSRLSGISAQGL